MEDEIILNGYIFAQIHVRDLKSLMELPYFNVVTSRNELYDCWVLLEVLEPASEDEIHDKVPSLRFVSRYFLNAAQVRKFLWCSSNLSPMAQEFNKWRVSERRPF